MNAPTGFTPPGEAQSEPTAAMSWPELGIYTLILLLAVALALKMPSHNR